MRLRRAVIACVVGVLTASLAQAVALPVASAAGGPSVELPPVASTPVTGVSMSARAPDDASRLALQGNQGAVAEKDGAGLANVQPLSPSATWDVATHTGDFTWSYPLRVPPVPGGLEPDLALSYRSSSVDGRTSATNNQASWVGEGWDLSPGFIERTYGGCAQDKGGGTVAPQTGDLCWRSDNATAVYAGGGGMLVRDDATGAWRPRDDDGSRIKRELHAGNGDDNGEHWVITGLDGTQYWFGSAADAKSTWTVPVFGDDANEPCNAASFAASHCAQAWRWNLDKVVDPSGNVVRYYYETETNSYGMNLKDTAVSYVRGGRLARIDYGLRAGVTTPAARVVFTPADRCVPGSACTSASPDNWPDVPWKAKCDAATCPDQYSPTFWNTKRLASVTTEVWRGTAHAAVDRWTLDHQYPDPGTGEKASLWLKGITHTGLVGGAVDLPPVTFEGTALPNRVDTVADGLSPINRFRVTAVVSEAGGVTVVAYGSECAPGGPMPADAHTNTLRCFPVRWAKPNYAERTDHFHKYVVTSVIQNDRTSSSRAQETRYEYLDGAAWHWDNGEFTPDDKRSWTEFRGFGRVRVRVGAPGDAAGPVTMTETRYYRGMDGDRQPTGTRPASVTDTEGGVRADSDWLAGFSFESATFEREGPSDQPDPPRIAKTISEPVVQGPTATRGAFKSHIVRSGTTRSYTAVAGGWRTTASTTSYDEYGLPYRVDDRGDTATAADDQCVSTTYARDTTKWLIDLPATERTVSVHCGETPQFPGDAVSAARTSYDANGNATKTEVAHEWTGADPAYSVTSTVGYDAHGRPTSTTDALNNTTKTAYTPETGGPLTKTAVTTPGTAAVPAGLVTTTTIEPAWGLPVLVNDPNTRKTETVHDPLGRQVKLWLPNRPRSENPKPSVATTHLVRKEDLSAVTTTRIGPNGTEITSTALFDGLLRGRQTQSPAFGGGRLITDTHYDSHGRAWKTTQPYFNDAPVDTTLSQVADTGIPAHSRTLFDGAGRATASVYFSGAHEKWRATTAHEGDRVHVTPVAGGTPTTTITNARGQVVELRKHNTPQPSESFLATRYTYTKAGQLETVTDPMGALWRYGYDLLGRRTTAEDPDTGRATTTYDALDRISTFTDARGSTIAHAYDALGRRTGSFRDSVTGAKLAEWTYDTVTRGKGKAATSTRWVGDTPYRSAVHGYTALYQPTQQSVTIPEAEGLLAGTYETFRGYDPDGSLSGETYPAGGELPEETVNYDYHDLGMPNTSSGAYNGVTHRHVQAMSYTKFGEVQRVELGSGTKRAWLSYYYESDTRRLKRAIVDAELPKPMQADVRYTRDAAGNITSVADTPADLPADVQCFRVDQQRRLTEAWTPAQGDWSETEGCRSAPSAALAGPAPYWHSYTYDDSGNRAKETRHAAGGDVVREFAHDVAGHAHAVGSVTTRTPQGDTTESYAYLPSGQTSVRPGQELTWDAEGRLAAVKVGAATTSFIYDADGNRLLRKDPAATTLYLGKQELRVAKAGGNPTATRYYGHSGRIVAMRQGTGPLTWLAADHQSTAQLAIDSDTQQVTRRRQLPFGGPRGAEAAWPGERGFVGGAQDKTSGLTHLGAREYDPAIGRFASADPIMDLSDPQQLNGYAYSANSPVTYSDPSGLIHAMCPDGDCQVGRKPAGQPSAGQSSGRSGGCGVPYVCPGQRYTGKPTKSAKPFLPPKPSWCGTNSCQGMKAWNDLIKSCERRPGACGTSPQRKQAPAPAVKTPPQMKSGPPIPKPKESEVTIAVCAGGSLQYMLAAPGYEACLAVDRHGMGWSTAEKAGAGNSIGSAVGADVGFKVAEGSIEDLGGEGYWWATDIGKRGGVEIARSTDGKWSGSAGVGVGAGNSSAVTAGYESAKSGRLPQNPGNPFSNPHVTGAIWDAGAWVAGHRTSTVNLAIWTARSWLD
ncbi:RHS repeat-associated core domain-containing protein [Actinokineospora sp. 24-640]